MRFQIVRDTREKAGHGWMFPYDEYCAGTIISKVNTGDYTVVGLEDYVCIERKETVQEFAQNCVKKRWFDCLARMSKIKHAYILFEFSWRDVQLYPMTAKVPQNVRMKLRLSGKFLLKNIHLIREKYGIHVLACGDKLRAEQTAYRILRKAYELQIRC